ncbi:MAG: N-acyl-D-amino-acid deacylase family protein [Promethearchaeota archaeon]|jgi:N-acyl-D-amino-acid deacylase
MYDLVIVGGRIVDGTGNPWFKADIGVSDGRISKIGNIDCADGSDVIKVPNLIVCPGFIDAHAHSDIFLLINPRGESMIRQGVTTQICGNCGSSLAPLNDVNRGYVKNRYGPLAEEVSWNWSSFDEYLQEMEHIGTSINFLSFVGNATVRTAVMGLDLRSPSETEIMEMKYLVRKAMEDGAFGLSTGLYYSPSGFADKKEIIGLCEEVAEYSGIYHTHIRGESSMVLESVIEAIEIGETSDVCVEIAHHKAYGKDYWHLIDSTLKVINEARERGVDVTCNVYPYTFGQTGLSAMIPYWVHAGGREELKKRLMDKATRERVKKEMREGISGWESHVKATGWDSIVVARCPFHEEYEGKSISKIALEKEFDPYDLALDLMLEGLNGRGRTSIRIFGQGEEDRRKVLKSRFSMIGSDGYALAPYGVLSKGFYHPRMYGCFPRLFKRYVREEGLLTVEEAVRKASSFPAQKLGIWDRGLIREGMWADIVIFDLNKIADKASEEEPYLYPEGIDYVIVNGVLTVQKGEHTGMLAGQILRHTFTVGVL